MPACRRLTRHDPRRLPVLLLLLALAGCGAAPVQRAAVPSPCAGGAEASYACQVERYQNVNVD